ncbi:MAG: flagellar basal body rod protein FlgB, partial [Bacillota bacterium]
SCTHVARVLHGFTDDRCNDEVMAVNRTDRVTLDVLSKALQAASLRQEAIAQNLANVDTPGYKALGVSFEEQLSRALSGSDSIQLRVTHPAHLRSTPRLSQVKPTLVRRTGTEARADGNNVDPEAENAALAENQLLYSLLTRLVSEKYSLLRHAISEGKR